METALTDETQAEAKPKPALNPWVEYIPLIIFLVVYNIARQSQPDTAIYLATVVFMVATAAAMAWSWLKIKRLPPMLIVTGVIVTVFGGLTLYLQDPTFIKMKPTMIYVLFAAALLGSALFGYKILKPIIGGVLTLPDAGWHTLAVRFALMYLAMAALNEYIWRNYSEAFWVNFKLMGFVPIFLVFTIAQIYLIGKKYPGAMATSKAED
jgi:intracellular septation protein